MNKVVAPVGLVLAVIAFAVSACGASRSPWPGVGVHDADRTTFQVKRGEEFAIAIDTRPRLDLHWSESHDTQRVVALDSKEVTDSASLQGGYGKMWFLFRALDVGETKIAFSYAGPAPSPPAESLIFAVDVK